MRLTLFNIAILALAPLVALAHGDLHLQIEEVTKRIAREPNNAELYLKRGELHRAHQEFDDAQADYDSASALNPHLAFLDLARGKMFLDANWPLSALVALDRFLASNSNHVDGLMTRARTLTRLGRRLQAVEDYTHAIAGAAQPQPEMFLERSQALTNEGPAYLSQALQGIDEGIKKLGPLVVLQTFAIDVELNRNQVDAALARVDGIAARSARKEKWLAQRGDILQQAGRNAEASEAYRGALQSLAALRPGLRQVPAMVELEKHVQAALEVASKKP